MSTVSLIAEKNEYAKYGFVTKTYGWMCLALFISAISSLITVHSPTLLALIYGGNGLGLKVLCILELALVFIFSLKLQEIPVWGAITVFVLYSVLNGLTLSSIFFIFTTESIVFCFFSAALMFGIMSLYGAITKKNLATVGHFLMLGLIGVLIVSLVNFVITLITHTKLEALEWLISFAMVIIFAGLTAYDTQKIMKTSQSADGSEAYQKIAIIAALELYLDFINIFLYLLKLLGKKRR